MFVSRAARFTVAATSLVAAAVIVVGLPAVNAAGQFADGGSGSGQTVPPPPPSASPNGHPWID
jgi:hypothetical protein